MGNTISHIIRVLVRMLVKRHQLDAIPEIEPQAEDIISLITSLAYHLPCKAGMMLPH